MNKKHWNKTILLLGFVILIMTVANVSGEEGKNIRENIENNIMTHDATSNEKEEPLVIAPAHIDINVVDQEEGKKIDISKNDYDSDVAFDVENNDETWQPIFAGIPALGLIGLLGCVAVLHSRNN